MVPSVVEPKRRAPFRWCGPGPEHEANLLLTAPTTQGRHMATLLETPRPSPSSRTPSETKQSLPAAIAMKAVTGFLVLSPAVGLAVALPLMWGNVVHLTDIIIGAG